MEEPAATVVKGTETLICLLHYRKAEPPAIMENCLNMFDRTKTQHKKLSSGNSFSIFLMTSSSRMQERIGKITGAMISNVV